MTAPLVCTNCSTELRLGAKFCHECGLPTGSRAAAAEYKQVTVLFADVVHSMDIAAEVGPERLREIMAQLVDTAAAVVRRLKGTLDKFTGDGIMAVFGAPVALEDHAVRACRAALEIQREIEKLGGEVARRDGVVLRLRIGLNSGQVIAGEIGTAATGYTAIGEQVGMAQRMQSVAAPGAVMLGPSTAQLVASGAVLEPPQTVHIKGGHSPVRAQRLLHMVAEQRPTGPSKSPLVGRERETATLTAMLQQTIGGQTSLAAVVGPAGIGKTRLVAEAARRAQEHGVDVLYTFCESHTTDVPFSVIARLLRDVLQLRGLDLALARQRVREQLPDADAQDLLLLDDLLGIAQPNVEPPTFDPHTRRRRLTAVVTTAQLARTRPVLIVVEDAHWIDEVSESMLAELVTADSSSRSMVLFTYRPEYRGVLREVADAQVITLGPLNDSQTSALLTELVGSDPSISAISRVIGERASGNPFFAEEIIRDLADRGVLVGERGHYTCTTDIGEIRVPATLQATLAARIDRLSPAAKLSLRAAAVIGFRFPWDLWELLHVSPAVDELITAELIDRVSFGPQSEYAFGHPLIRTVAYESQLSSDRAELHRRLAAGIEAQQSETVDQNAALIAEHLEAAGEIRAAYDWHMRAADWATNRDIAAARVSWERATRIADRLPADDPECLAMRIAPRTMLCGCAYRFGTDVESNRFDELRELCVASDDMTSLFIAMLGLVTNHVHRGRVRQGSQLAAEVTAEIHAIDPELTTDSVNPGIDAADATGAWREALRRSHRGTDPRQGESAKSALAFALCQRARVRYWVGRPGWRDDLEQSLAMAREAGTVAHARVVSYAYLPAIPAGVLEADDPNHR